MSSETGGTTAGGRHSQGSGFSDLQCSGVVCCSMIWCDGVIWSTMTGCYVVLRHHLNLSHPVYIQAWNHHE